MMQYPYHPAALRHRLGGRIIRFDSFHVPTLAPGMRCSVASRAYWLGLVSWDHGFDKDGKQIWGAVKGPNVFRRVEAEAPNSKRSADDLRRLALMVATDSVSQSVATRARLRRAAERPAR